MARRQGSGWREGSGGWGGGAERYMRAEVPGWPADRKWMEGGEGEV